MRAAAVIVAAGQARRMNGVNKQFIELCGRPVIAHVLDAFLACSDIERIALVVAEDNVDAYERWLRQYYGFFEDITIIAGGPERQYSVLNGLTSLPEGIEAVAIHDGARPMVTPHLIERSLGAAIEFGAAAVAVPVKDTIKQADGQDFVSRTLNREMLWAMQTPQAFRYDIIMQAHQLALEQGYLGTDDAVLVERAGYRVKLIMGAYDNIKITTPDDVPMAEALMQQKGVRRRNALYCQRMGIGCDVHRLVEGRPLVLGGVDIPFDRGLLGHSDADVLLHAVMDALLGAAALGDIGRHFPDSDERYKGISSIELLKEVYRLLADRGYAVDNVDATVIAQRPKLAPYIWSMRRRIAAALGISVGQVSVKATTTEGLGFVGRQEGIEAQAVATLLCL